MKLKIYSSIIILLLAVSFLSAQPDSLAVVNDSLLVFSDSLSFNQAREDSLRVQALLDSLENQKPEVDYEAYKNLVEKVEEYKNESRNRFKGDKNKELFWSVQGHLFGLSSDNYQLKKDNFTELASLYPTFLKLQNYNRFYGEQVTGDFYNLNKEYYDLPVTAIEVVAGTGDYDLGAGYVSLQKNQFLDKYNLDFRMNFVKGDLYYGSELASNSSANLIIPLENSQLDIAFNSISYEGPYYRLSPAFRLNTSIFEENSHSMSLFYTNSYLDLGLKYSTETLKHITEENLTRDYWQLSLSKKLASENWQGQIAYEYFIHNEDFYSQELNSLSSDIDHLLSLDFNSNYERLNLTNKLLLANPAQLLSNTSLDYKLTDNWKVGTFTNFRKSLKKKNLLPNYSVSSNSETADSSLDSTFYLNEKNYIGFDVGYANSDLNLAAKVGYASIESQLFNSEFNHDYIALKSQVSGTYSHTFGKYQLNLASLMKYYIETLGRDIHYTPKASMTNSLEVSRDMNHDNYVKAGIAYHYFDAFLAFENLDEVLYSDSSLLDLYFGIQITKQFEITAYWKNILDNYTIAGQQSLPQSITALISWNFLN